MKFVFDLDDTICATDEYSEKYIREFLSSHNLPYKQIATKVRHAEAKFDWDEETAIKWYKQFGDQMISELPCKKGAAEFLHKLRAAGHEIIIATARANDWHTNPREITFDWLARNQIPYDKIYIGRVDKEKVCEEVEADFFIDDDLSIVENVAKYFAKCGKGKQAFLSTTLFNENLPAPNGVIRVRDFGELENVCSALFRSKKD